MNLPQLNPQAARDSITIWARQLGADMVHAPGTVTLFEDGEQLGVYESELLAAQAFIAHYFRQVQIVDDIQGG